MGKVKDLYIDIMNDESSELVLEQHPSGDKEEEIVFGNPDTQAKHIKNESDKQDIEERRKFAQKAYCIAHTWMTFLIAIAFLQFLFGKSAFVGLTALEFNIVFTSASASVFGFWYLVGRYLFNTKK